jgi:nucleotide-binding universal stress UspA family protein
MVGFNKVLFPTDFSSNSSNALLHAAELTRFKGELIIQHVVSNYFDRYPHWTTIFDIHELQKHLDFFVEEEMARTLPELAGKVSIRRVISKGKPAQEIAALAEKELVDLIVMGSAKGVVTNKVIRITNRPVLAVSSEMRSGAEKPVRAKRILVATDFSDHSKRIVQYAFELKEAFGAAIYLLYVIETTKAIEFAFKQGHYTDAQERMREWALNELVNLVPDEAIGDSKIVTLVETGNPSDRIATVAAEIGADLTILGTHEYGMVQKHLLGTTTDKLLNTLGTPLLTVKL